MVDTISNAKSIRQTGSATTRYGSPSVSSDPVASSKAVAPISASADAGRREQDGQREQDAQREFSPDADNTGLRLEISQDESGSEVIYRFVDARSGTLVREWDAEEFGKLRDYVRDKKIHLLDKKV